MASMKKKYAHQNLDESEKTLESILNIIREGVWDWDVSSGHVERSPGWYRMLGYEVDSFKKDVLTWENIIHPDDYHRVMAHFEAYIKGATDTYRIEYRCKRRDGLYLWIEDKASIIEKTPDGAVLRIIGAHLDIDDAKRARDELKRQNALLRHDNVTLENLVNERTAELDTLNARLREQLEYTTKIARFDRLTSVYNRYMFEELLLKEISRSRRYGRPMSLIMIDIDYFKQINDDFGHQTGDGVLAQIAAIIKRNIRDSDMVARWGGEEFVLILPGIPQDKAAVLAENLRKLIADSIFENGITLTCSFGVTAFREDDDVDTVFGRIDKALYRAKELERNNVQCE